MCKALRASMLVLLLSCTAQAGWMQGGSPEPPPPPPSPALVVHESPGVLQEAPADGDILDATTRGFIEAALNVLSGVLSLT